MLTVRHGETDPSDLKKLTMLLQVLMVKNVTGIFRGFAEKSAADGFWRRMAHITGIWCCNYDGGIAYRMAPRLNSTISASL